jgi:hypothetical protein
MSEQTNQLFLEFLNKCGLNAQNMEELNKIIIPRENLLSITIYDSVKNDIPELKKKFSSSKLTSLQKNANINQKWPLLNIVRQILKVYGFLLNPIRKSDGYDKNGKKKIKRFFIIEKIKKIQEP